VEAAEALDYIAVLTGNGADNTQTFNSTTAFENLDSGTYTLCLTVDGEPDFEVCYDLEVPQPEDLSVSGKVSTLGKEITLDLSGGKEYRIVLNGQRYQTRASSITLRLDQPVNQLEVRTDQECQGVYTQSITLTEQPIALPNPIDSGDLRVFVPAEDGSKIRIRMFTMSGSSLLNKEVVISNGEVRVNMDGYARGVYLLNVSDQDQLYSYKIIKR
jgi:hypothetical protein